MTTGKTIFPMIALNMLQNKCSLTSLSLSLNPMTHKGTVSPGLAWHLAHSRDIMNVDSMARFFYIGFLFSTTVSWIHILFSKQANPSGQRLSNSSVAYRGAQIARKWGHITAWHCYGQKFYIPIFYRSYALPTMTQSVRNKARGFLWWSSGWDSMLPM